MEAPILGIRTAEQQPIVGSKFQFTLVHSQCFCWTKEAQGTGRTPGQPPLMSLKTCLNGASRRQVIFGPSCWFLMVLDGHCMNSTHLGGKWCRSYVVADWSKVLVPEAVRVLGHPKRGEDRVGTPFCQESGSPGKTSCTNWANRTPNGWIGPRRVRSTFAPRGERPRGARICGIEIDERAESVRRHG